MDGTNNWLQYAPRPRELTDDDEWNIFLSYRSVNRSWVLNLYDVLRGLGHKVFFDQCVLKPGDPLTRRLEQALTTSQAGILIWSNAARDSDWIRDEYETMKRQAREKHGFQFVPIKLDNAKLPDFAENRIFLDFSSYPDGPNGGELLKLLYAVVGKPMSTEVIHVATQHDEEAQKALTTIEAAVKNAWPERLIQLFNEGGLPWQTSAAMGCKVAEGLIRLNRPEQAIEILRQVGRQFPKAIRPKQLLALALARHGDDSGLMEAQEILGMLYVQDERDPETVGIYARTWMDRYQKSQDISDLKQSRDLYVEAFAKAPDDYFTGINAAAKSIFLGSDEDLQQAATYIQQVKQLIYPPNTDNYWSLATWAEILLMEKKYAQAAHWYEIAVAAARKEVGSHKTTWLQARRLMDKLQPTAQERAQIAKVFEHLPDDDQS
jgi:tetratricopeptide (TPR) repeat protein